jgi:hypothetical protein
MSSIVNLTPHSITVKDCTSPSGEVLPWVCPPSGAIARAIEHSTPAEPIDGIPTTTTTFGVVEGLPPPSEGTYYILSSLAADAAYRTGRPTEDLLVPGQQIRDEAGKIVGCASLCRWTPKDSSDY